MAHTKLTGIFIGLILTLLQFQIPSSKARNYTRTMYDWCHKNGDCLGLTWSGTAYDSNRCIKNTSESCDFIGSYECGCGNKINHECSEKYNNLTIKLLAKKSSIKESRNRNMIENGYLAGAFSEDRKMGEDLVAGCIWNKNNINGVFSFNRGQKNLPVEEEEALQKLIVVQLVSDEEIYYCELRIRFTKLTIYKGTEFRFEKVNNFLLAAGQAKDNQLKYHYKTKMSSKYIYWHEPNNNTAVDPAYFHEKFHGSYMIFCWIVWIPLGTFVSRFYKETWVYKRIMKQRLWYYIHSIIMMLGFAMFVCSYVCVIYDRQYITSPAGSITQAHGGVGFTAIFFLVVQCIFGWCRPRDPALKKYAGIIHCIIGNLIYFLGILNIVMAPHWTYNAAPEYLTYEALGWFLCHMLIFAGMSMYVEWTDRHLSIQRSRAFLHYPMPIVSHQEAPRPKLRRNIFIGFAVFAVLVSALMITTIYVFKPYEHYP